MIYKSTLVNPVHHITVKNVNNTRFTDDVITRDKTEYSSHALAEVVDGKHKNDWIFITMSRTGKL